MASPESEIENGRKQELPGLSGEVPSTRGMSVLENEKEVEDRNAVSLKGRQFPAGISNDNLGVVLDRHAEITSTSTSPRHDTNERENDVDNRAEEGDLGAAHAADYEAFMTETAEDDIASYRKSVEPAKAWQYDKSSDGGGRENSQPMIAPITDGRTSSSPSKDFSLSNWPDSATEDPEHMISVSRNAEADECTSRAEVLDVTKLATEENNDKSRLNKSQFASRYTAFPAEQITWDAPTRSDWLAEEIQASSLVNQVPQEQDGQFEQVSLQDPQEQTTHSRSGSSLLEKIGLGSFGHLDKTPGFSDNNYGTPASVATKFTADDNENLTAASGPGLEESIRSPDSQKSSPKSFSSLNTSSFSLDERSSFSSPVSSPLLKRGKAVLPNASPELMRLIDSAIQQSDPSSLQKLKTVVAEETLHTYEEGVSFSTSNIVVDVLLAKMGVPEARREDKDTTAPRMMLSVGAALVAGELIPWLPSQECSQSDVDPRTRMVKGLATVLKACTRNRAMCSAAGLLKVLLAACRTIFSSSSNPEAGTADTWNASPLFDILAVLGSHCLTVQNLQDWLHTVTETIPMCRALDVASTLERALAGEETKGPSHTFEFDGESSGLLGPGESRWPFVNGYAFATWLYIESFADTVHTAATAAAIAAAAVAKSGKSSAMSAAAAASALAGEGTVHMPRLFSFLSADNQGVEAYFHGQFLVVEIASSKGKKASLHFTYSFKPRQWYFVGLEHSYRQSLLGKAESEVKLYIDGCLYESRPFEFPRVSKPLAFCCIGTNPPPTMAGLQRRRRQCPLFAEMGPVYIFKEPIGEDKMGRLAARGGDTVPSFGSGAGMPSFSTNELIREAAEEAMALDFDLGPCLHLLYHPKLLVGRTCPDASPAGAAGTHRRPAEVLGHVHIAARVRPVEAIWAMGEGGPLSLLPLAISAADKDSFEPIVDDPITASRAAVLAAPILHMISLSLQHPGNAEELLRGHASQLLARLLAPILCAPLQVQEINAIRKQERPDARNEEVVAAVVLLAQAPASNENLKVQLFGKLLLDLKLWSRCSYGLQKKLLSSLADMVFTESATMRAANAVQVLLDCCRKCYWVIPEPDSVHMFAGGKLPRPVGELNALIDELLVVIELLLGTSRGAVASTDVQSLVRFLLDCPQPNQVARVLHLLYRLVVQPNASRAAIFAENFLYCGGIEMLLALLQRECEAGEDPAYMHWLEKEQGELELQQKENNKNEAPEVSGIKQDVHVESDEDGISPVQNASPPKTPENITRLESLEPGTRMTGQLTGRNLGGIGLSITADKAKNNFRNIDSADGVMVGIISLLGALVTGGHLKLPSSSLSSSSALNAASNPISAPLQTSASTPTPSTVISGEQFQASIDSGGWLLYALQKAFQTAPKRLLTDSIYEALLAAVIRSEAASLSSDDRLNLYDSLHSFEHTQLLLVLLRALPYGSKSLQSRALQDVLFLACTRSENRMILTAMPEWPEWLLEILISNYEAGSLKLQEGGANSSEIEDLVYNFLIIILEHSMRQKDGWKDVESTIHCAEWLAMIGGTTSGEQRQRREESLPIIKRKLLGGLLDFAARELQLQTQVVAAAAAGVAAGGLSPKEAKAEADAAAFLSVSLAENAIVLLMLVEDHLRLQCQVFNPSLSSAPLSSGPASPRSFMPSPSLMGLGRTYSDGGEGLGSRRFSSTQDSGGLSLDVLASMADSNGQISAAAMERLTAAAAAEPYESVRCAFVSYGSCGVDLVDGWKRRSRMWYGVGLPARGIVFGGGGSGWDAWMSVIEKDENGEWIELPLIRKSISMLQALLLDDSGAAAGGSIFGYGGGAGTGAGGMHALQQLLDSDQPFFTMLRMVLVAMREEDKGSDKSSPNLSRTRSTVESFPSKVSRIDSFSSMSGNIVLPQNKKTKAALLWCVLAPLLTMPLTESRRQRVLVSACILYSEVWHAVSADKKVLRRHYLEMIIPPFATLLRRWRPLLSGIHELTDADGQSPLAVEDRSLAIDAHPLEAASAMVTPEWAAAFASPPAAMALAMAAAGAGGGEVNSSKGNQQKREFSALEKKTSRLRSFATFQKVPDSPGKILPPPKDKAAAKAAAMAAARDQERAAKIGSGRGLGAVAMASSAQRRTSSDRERAKRWGIFESMNSAWLECAALQGTGHDFQEREGNVASLKLFLSLQEMMEIARTLQQTEARRRLLCLAADENDASMGARSWRLLVRHLLEMEALFGSVAHQILEDQRIFWKLDTMENSMRMRKRMKRNYKGTNHYGAAADHVDAQEIGGNSGGVLFEKDSEASLRKTALPPEAANLLPEQQIFDEAGDDETFQNNASEMEDRRDDRLSVSSKQSSLEDHTLTGSSMFNTATSVGSPSSLIGNAQIGSTDMNEKLLLDIPTVLVQPLRTSKGTFQVTSRHIIFSPDDSVQLDESGKEDTQVSKLKPAGTARAWSLSALREVYSRRYLLRKSALELFMVDRSNYFFDFETAEGRRKAYKALVQARPPFMNNINAGTQRPEQLLKRTQLTERWARWEISNFEYLMQLNTLAGRSYNDITQYPVFPWILADYSSESLDFDNPNIYRDLSKPVGALNSNRLEKYLERYENFDDPLIPRFHYGSHYSSAGTVLYYLVRLEPFTTLSIQLQGGKFDHADRMFGDIGSTWNGVLEDMSDVKELVPELFYLPEILLNINKIGLGKTQKGENLENVKLPPWAASPVDFVQKHRAALESQHVSANLHNWIDLIFGYKQRGKEAVAANNVFFYMTYEGAVDIDKIDDPVLRKATQDQIAYFGQTPSQLLTSPHIKRMPLEDVIHLQTIFRNPSAAQCYTVPFCERCNVPAGAIATTHESVITVDMNAPACTVAVHRWQPHTPDGHGLPFHFQHGKPAASSGGGALVRMFSRQAGSGATEWRYPRAVSLGAPGVQSCHIVAITQDGNLLTGGHADNSLKLVAGDTARVLESAFGHCAPITCLSLSPDGTTCITGSRDCTAMLWRIHSNSSASPSSSNHIPDTAMLAAGKSTTDNIDANIVAGGRKRRIEGPIHVLRGHVDDLMCCCVNADLDVAVSCSQLRGVLIHSLVRGRLMRRLHLSGADVVALSSEGILIVWDKDSRCLSTFTINGIQMAAVVLPTCDGDVSCITVATDGHHAVVGTSCTKYQQPDVSWYANKPTASEVWQHFNLPDSQQPGIPSRSEQGNAHSNEYGKEDGRMLYARSREEIEAAQPCPVVTLFDLHTLQAIHKFKLQQGQDVTALALNRDSTNLVVSTADGQLFVYTDPALSIKVVDQMLRLGWQGAGLAGYIS